MINHDELLLATYKFKSEQIMLDKQILRKYLNIHLKKFKIFNKFQQLRYLHQSKIQP